MLFLYINFKEDQNFISMEMSGVGNIMPQYVIIINRMNIWSLTYMNLI